MNVTAIGSARAREHDQEPTTTSVRKMPLSEDFHSHRSDVDVVAYAKNTVDLDSDAYKVDLGNTMVFISGARMDDVRQGFIGDCTVMASLAALARTPPWSGVPRESHPRELWRRRKCPELFSYTLREGKRARRHRRCAQARSRPLARRVFCDRCA
jgi:hypothetical protein